MSARHPRAVRRAATTRAWPTLVGAAALGLTLVGCGETGAPTPAATATATALSTVAATEAAPTSASTDGVSTPTEEPPAAATESPGPTAAPEVGPPATPTSLVIGDGPTWELTALGVDADGFINPPAQVVQWYDESPRPGEPGIAVIAGHVTYGGLPDAFADLDETTVGEEVVVVDEEGVERRFEVTEVRYADKDDVMSDQDVWGTSDVPRLAIVTCDDASAVEDGGHFAGNLVVEAVAVDG